MCISRISGFRPKAHGGKSRIISFSLQAMLWFSSFQRCLGSVVNSHCGSSRRSSVDSRSFVTVVRRLCLRLASSVLAGKTKIEPCHCTKHIKNGCHERQATFQNATRQKQEQPLLMISSNWPVPSPNSSRLTLSCYELLKYVAVVDLKSLTKLISNSYLYLSYKVIVMICKCKWNFIMLSYRDYIHAVYTMYINPLQVIRTSEVLSTSTSSWHSLPWRRQRWWHWEIQPRSSTSSKGSSKFSPSSLSLFRPATLHTIDLHFVFILCIWTLPWYSWWCGIC